MTLTMDCEAEMVCWQGRRLTTDPQYNRDGLHASDEWLNHIPEDLFAKRYIHTKVAS